MEEHRFPDGSQPRPLQQREELGAPAGPVFLILVVTKWHVARHVVLGQLLDSHLYGRPCGERASTKWTIGMLCSTLPTFIRAVKLLANFIHSLPAF